MKIPTSRARLLAIERLIEVMQEQLETELEALNDADNVGNLYLPPPPVDAYFIAPSDPETILPTNQHIAVYVYPATGRRLQSRGSAGVTRVAENRTFQLDVLLACRVSSSAEIERNQKKITSLERLFLRSELYTGAIIETVQKYGCDGGTIHFIDLIDDQAALLFDAERKAVGIATARFEVTQNTSAPLRRPLPQE